MAVLNPDHLLDQARKLIAPPGAGAPRQVDLRRAISAAYYAVLHAVATAAADDLVGKTHRDSARYGLAYRSIDHGHLRRICEELSKATLPAKYARYEPKGGFSAGLKAFAKTVGDLQEKRHTADYDPLFRATTADAMLATETARAALQLLRAAPRAEQRAFLALAVFSTRA